VADAIEAVVESVVKGNKLTERPGR
jgi:hypothetical protein